MITIVILIAVGLFWQYNRTDQSTDNNMAQQTISYLIDGQAVMEADFQLLKNRLKFDDQPPITGRTAPEPGTDKFGSTASWGASDSSTGESYEYSEHFTETTVTKELRRVSQTEEEL